MPLLQTDASSTRVYRPLPRAARWPAVRRCTASSGPSIRRWSRATSSAPSEVIEKSGLITVGLTKLFGACFAFALLLAVAGTYGLMSASIGLRTREIGVRRALGASEAMATRMLLTQGARQLGVGTLIAAPVLVVIGVAAAQPASRSALRSRRRPASLVSVAIVAVVLAATWLPTRRVLRVPLRDAIWKA